MPKVSLEEMLEEREWRAKMQKNWVQTYNLPVISFSLNIPGERKDFLLAGRLFDLTFEKLLKRLADSNIPVMQAHPHHKKTGPIGFITASAPARKIKALTVRFEEGEKAGRLLDIDVIDTDGQKVQRADLRLPLRKCLICSKEAFACARSRAHPVDELFTATVELVKEATDPAPLLRQVATTISDALLFEVAITPKPGLVDRHNSGAHHDMDFFTFIKSTHALHDYFYEFAATGYKDAHLSPPALFNILREIGTRAEHAMFHATKGVNTHKGLIFSLGNIAASFGYLVAKGIDPRSEDLCDTVKQMTARLVEKDLFGITTKKAKTSGEKLYIKYGVTGIRGEVSSGFQTVRKSGLPVLIDSLKAGTDINDAGVDTLLSIMSVLDDTNVLARQDRETLAFVKEEASKALALGGMKTKQGQAAVLQMDEAFIQQNISPGGAADLLAVTIALLRLEDILSGHADQ